MLSEIFSQPARCFRGATLSVAFLRVAMPMFPKNYWAWNFTRINSVEAGRLIVKILVKLLLRSSLIRVFIVSSMTKTCMTKIFVL